jgi:hypothetical protein
MTRRPRKVKARSRPARKVAKRAKSRIKPKARDPLDEFIVAGARSLNLKIEQAWLPEVRNNLAVTLRLGDLVAGFTLPDDAEPAPVFKA